MINLASASTDVLKLYQQHRLKIDLEARSDLQAWQKERRHQNLNPVKVLTSGLEVKVDKPIEASGKIRDLDRCPWWSDYQDNEYCSGHYSRPYGQSRGSQRAVCVDYGVAQRWVPKVPGGRSPKKWRLVAIRYPELQVLFDDGDGESIMPPE